MTISHEIQNINKEIMKTENLGQNWDQHWFELAKERLIKLEDSQIEIMKSEEQRAKTKIDKESHREIQDTLKNINIHVMRMPEVEE